MTFYERYERICLEKGIEPCSESTAQMLGLTRGGISTWKKNQKTPLGETVAKIADGLHISADYLLGRTDDPTDYTNPDLIAEQAGAVLDGFDGDVKQAMAFRAAVDADVKKERDAMPHVLELYYQLDASDQAKIEIYMEGMLATDAYTQRKKQA